MGVPYYSLFVGLGFAAGLAYYFAVVRRSKASSDNAGLIVVAAIVCGFIGAKVPLMFEGGGTDYWLYGKSVLGALIAGSLGVMLVKRMLGIKLRLGNVIAPPVALGIAIGRLGCFFNGCCYGMVAPFGMNFGDGQTRLPTQLFESAFNLAAFVVLHRLRDRVKTPGILLKGYLLAYFVFRFANESVRVNPRIWHGLTIYQIICVGGVVLMGLTLFGRVRFGQSTR
jgi:phosphatidylglycerol:prolipoprotein diacylglycerol transferase